MDADEFVALVGHRFPGGDRVIEHWENWLLTDCTGRDPMPDGLVHPVALFHVPIQGVGMSIAELFALGQVSGAGSVGLDGYDWEYLRPLREDVAYRFEGRVVEAERLHTPSGKPYDRFVFTIELSDPDGPVAVVTNHWRLRREAPGDRESKARAAGKPAGPGAAQDLLDIGLPTGDPLGLVGSQIPEWAMPVVDPQRMKTMAAILRDPYEIHWDSAATASIGLGERVVNQGPLNLSYVANMVMAWQGPASVRRLRVRFTSPVFGGDAVVARGRVIASEVVEGDERAVCDVGLWRGDEQVVEGRAVVAVG